MRTTFDPAKESTAAADFVWIFILALAGLGVSQVISCVAPFVALAVALAGTVRLALAMGAMTLLWLANQFIGFFYFPRTPNTVLWGLALGGAAVLATVVAAKVMKRAQAMGILARVGLAFVLGFATYEGCLRLAALFLGGIETFAPAIIAQIALINLVSLAGLTALNELVARLCKPWLGVMPHLLKPA